jgi:acetyl esterase/lipase
MKKYLILTICIIFTLKISIAQQNETNDSVYKKYVLEQEVINHSFSEYFYGNYTEIYSLNESKFISIMDSLRKSYTDHRAMFEKDHPYFDKSVMFEESKEIQFYFDKLLLEYPYYHERFTGEKIQIKEIKESILQDFNNPELLCIESFTKYIKAFLYHKSKIELEDTVYKRLDNQQLIATLNLIPEYFSNKKVIEYLKFDYLYNHIDNFGTKNIENIYQDFITTCNDTAYVNKIKAFYTEEESGRKGHIIRTYKTVDNFNLEIHLFLPENKDVNEKRPVMVYFSGGSWSEGKPDWNFSACQSYSKKDWVGVTIEYRLAYRHGTLPFEAVMDAKSAIRWLRQHANEYNIDTTRIVASGNSAGGHLILAAALVENWNEKTDDLRYSPVPNVLLVNSGVYDLTDDNTGWIRQVLKERNQDEKLVEEISPNYLIKNNFPPALIIHGTNDYNVPFSTAEQFVKEMKKEGNGIEFHPIEDAGHFIWFGRYGKQVSELRSKFLEKCGY